MSILGLSSVDPTQCCGVPGVCVRVCALLGVVVQDAESVCGGCCGLCAGI